MNKSAKLLHMKEHHCLQQSPHFLGQCDLEGLTRTGKRKKWERHGIHTDFYVKTSWEISIWKTEEIG
jgi:hypothetical protein